MVTFEKGLIQQWDNAIECDCGNTANLISIPSSIGTFNRSIQLQNTDLMRI